MAKKTGAKAPTKKKTTGDKKSGAKKLQAKWRKVLLKKIGVADDVQAKLAKANILTVGDADDYLLGETTFDAVNNVTKEEADDIVRLLDDWFIQNPRPGDDGEEFDEYLIPDVLPENHKKLLTLAKKLKVAQGHRKEAADREIDLKDLLIAEFEIAKIVATPDGKRSLTIDGYKITIKDNNPTVSIKQPKVVADKEDEDDEEEEDE